MKSFPRISGGLRNLDRRWGVPVRGLALLALLLLIGGAWMSWRVTVDNRMYRQWLSTLPEGQGVNARIFCDWLPTSTAVWLEKHELVLFPRCLQGVYVSQSADPQIVRWITHLPGCASVVLESDALDELLPAIVDAPALNCLELRGLHRPAGRQAIDLESLSATRRLKELRISQLMLDERAVAALQRLPSLETLHLETVEFPDDLGDWLAALRQLRVFSASYCTLSAASLAGAADLPSDCKVDLAFFGADEVLLQRIATVSQLRRLQLTGGLATDAGLAALAGHQRLESLTLVRMHGISDAALPVLAKLPQLMHLRLDDVPVSDAGLMHFASAPELVSLSLRGTRVTKEAADRLKRQVPAVDVEWWVF